MWGFIWGIIEKVLGLVLKTSPAPSPEAQQAKEAGSAETALAAEESANAEVQKAADAGVAVERSTDSDDGLRKYETTDPQNRDNQA